MSSNCGEQVREHRAGLTLAIASLGTLLVLMVFTIPLTTLTSTAVALGAGPGAQAWILSAMSVGAASGLLASGALGDDYGRRRIFVAGALVLVGSSVIGALAPTALVLVVSRILQGLGGAAMIACGLGLIGHAFQAGRARARATGIWAAALGAGVALGPIVSAWLDMSGGWYSPYAASAAAALVVAVAGWLWLDESRADQPRSVDWAGTLLLGLGIAVLLAGLVEGRSGWERPLTVELIVGGLLLLGAFVAAERLNASPMLDLGLFRRPDFVGATIGAFAAGAGVLSQVSLVPLVLERAMGIGTLTSAFVLLAWSATSVFSAYGARWLPESLTPRMQLVCGLIGVAVAQLMLGWLSPGDSAVRLLPGMFLAGVANGVLNAALGHEAVSSVPQGRAAMGSGANNTARYVGSGMGLAVVTVLITHAGSVAGVDGLLAGWNEAVLVTTAFSLIGAAVVYATGRRAAVKPEELRTVKP